MRTCTVAVATTLLLVAIPAAGQTEHILSYDSDIVVSADGSLTVTETIRARATGNEIKRGIYRDFPVRYAGRYATRMTVPFEVVRVLRDGQPESYHTEDGDPYRRVYIGRKNVFLKPGEYTYTLTYRTNRQIGFFDDHDELYWNVTGTKWAFPIDRASASVTLPSGTPREQIRVEGYTGPKGAKAQNYAAEVDATGTAIVHTTRPLGKEEGLTIVVSFPKGIVVEPTGTQNLYYLFMDNPAVTVGVAGLVVVLAYYILAWYLVGRDPAKGVIIPLFEPPEGLSPAAVRYVNRMGYDTKCFAAAVVDMAVKGHITIANDDDDYTLDRTDDGKEDLSREEGEILKELLETRKSIELDKRHHHPFQAAVKAIKSVLSDNYVGKYFFSNTKWFVFGAALSVLTLGGVALASFLTRDDPAVGFLSLWLSLWSIGVFALVRQMVAAWRAVLSGAGERLGKTSSAVMLTVFAVLFCIAEVVVMGFLVAMTSIMLLPPLIVIGALNVWFYRLLKRPTVGGRNVMDQVDGFGMYLGTAEQSQLAYAHSPERTPELFERYLPYALALDVENVWAESFSDVLARAGEGGEPYTPTWYRGVGWATLGATGFAAAAADSLTGALSSAGTSPGSSSGSGGGGSSGGGGGGGGGGGW